MFEWPGEQERWGCGRLRHGEGRLDICVSAKLIPLSSLQVINFYAGANQSMNVTCVGKVSFSGLAHLPTCVPFVVST